MSPVQTAIQETIGGPPTSRLPYPRPDAVFAPPKDALLEIVVDWQMPADEERANARN